MAWGLDIEQFRGEGRKDDYYLFIIIIIII